MSESLPLAESGLPDPIVLTLTEARRSHGLSLEAVGRLMGRKTYQTVYQLEHETYDPRLSTLRAWASALGYDVTLTRVAPPIEGDRCPICGWTEGHNPRSITCVMPPAVNEGGTS